MQASMRRAGGVFDAPLHESVIVLHAGTGHYHEFNAIAARIWSLLGEPVTEEAIVDALVADHDVTPEECRIAVAQFLDELRARKLLEER